MIQAVLHQIFNGQNGHIMLSGEFNQSWQAHRNY